VDGDLSEDVHPVQAELAGQPQQGDQQQYEGDQALAPIAGAHPGRPPGGCSPGRVFGRCHQTIRREDMSPRRARIRTAMIASTNGVMSRYWLIDRIGVIRALTSPTTSPAS